MPQKLNSLDIKGTSKDPAYARQDMKPYYQPCTVIIKITVVNYFISKGVSITLLKRDREAAQNAGYKNGVFTCGQGESSSSLSLLQRALNIRICLYKS